MMEPRDRINRPGRRDPGSALQRERRASPGSGICGPGRRRAGAAAVALLLGAAAAALPAGPAYAATWTVVASPNASSDLNILNGVDARGMTNGWAVGHANHSSQPVLRPLVLSWNGTGWTQTGTPALSAGGTLRGVDASASDNAWAVGSTGSRALAERWNGSAWSVASTAQPANATSATLEGVKTYSAGSAWAVGSYSASSAPHTRTLIERWNGTAWTVVPSPNPDPDVNLLSDVDGVSATDAWAIGNVGNDGYGGTLGGVVLRYNGSTWSSVTVPGATSDSTLRVPVLEDVLAVSATDVWIVGRAFHLGLFRQVPIFMHWNGQQWRHGFVPNAPAGGFSGITALSPTQVYAVGEAIARWTGSAWALENATVPGRLTDAVAAAPGTVLTVGYRYDSTLSQVRTLSMRTANG